MVMDCVSRLRFEPNGLGGSRVWTLLATARYRCSFVTKPRSSTFPARTRLSAAALDRDAAPSRSHDQVVVVPGHGLAENVHAREVPAPAGRNLSQQFVEGFR